MAIPVWNGMVATVLDFAETVRLLSIDEGRVVSERDLELPRCSPAELAGWLSRKGVDELVCGAVSSHLEWLLENTGIGVTPFISGSLSEVVPALLEGRLDDPRLRMAGAPGGPGRRLRWRGGRGDRRGRR